MRPITSSLALACQPAVDLPVREASLTLQPTVCAERVPTSEELRWEKFEREYGIGDPSGSPVLQRVQGAQYNVDVVMFSLQKAATMDFPIRNMTPDDLDNSPFGALRDGELKTVVSTHDNQTGTAFVGVKLVFPVGN